MRLADIIYLAFAALKDRKLRTILTILGMVVGPAIYVAVIASTEGLNDSISNRLKTIGVETIFVAKTGRSEIEITDKLLEDVSRIQGVKDVIPFYLIGSGYAKSKGKTVKLSPTETYSVLAIDFKDIEKIFPGIKLKNGRVPAAKGDVAVIGLKVSEPDSMELPRIMVGDAITLIKPSPEGEYRSVSLLVRGVFEGYGQSFFLNPDILVFVPIDAGRKLTEERGYSGMFVVTEGATVVEYVEETLRDKYGSDLTIFSTKTVLQIVQLIMGSMTMFLGSMASMSLLVAFLAIMTTMFTAVTERIREIGLLKALGFKTRDVLLSFLTEAALIGLIGGLIGAAAGALGSYILTQPSPGEEEAMERMMKIRGSMGFHSLEIAYLPKLTPELILTAIGMAFLVGIVAGIIPAWKAAKYTPVEALRRE